ALFMCVTFTVEYGTHIIYLFLHTGDKHHRVDSRVSSLAWDGEHWRRQSRLPSSKNTTASRRAAIRVWKCARKGLPSIALSATASFLGVFLLTFAHSFAFRAFCLLTGLVLFLSATIAAVVAPVLLYYLEPFLPSVSRQG
ncbi:putative transmembrane protein, partial [Toxoplasma gondii VAND]